MGPSQRVSQSYGRPCVGASLYVHAGGEEADDEKSVRGHDGDPQVREGDGDAGVEEQGALNSAYFFLFFGFCPARLDLSCTWDASWENSGFCLERASVGLVMIVVGSVPFLFSFSAMLM